MTMKSLFRLILFLLTALSLTAFAQDKRPNILFAFADDWGKYATSYAALEGPDSPSSVMQTPHFDRIAKEGVLFENAFVTAPSCTPCRSSILSGQYFYRTGRAAILQGAIWDPSIPTYPLLLRDEGYHVGFTYKVWSPGSPRDAGHGGPDAAYHAAGRSFNGFSQTATKLMANGMDLDAAKAKLLGEVDANFDAYLADREEGQPFCYWFGPTNVHRTWTQGSGKALWGIDPDDLKGKLPEFLPDVPTVREDFADYLGEVMAFDQALGVILKKLEELGELDNTLLVVSGDHGAPGFPRGKCNLYDFGTHVTLAVRFPKAVPSGRVLEDYVNLMDLAPTFLEAAGAEIPKVMTGKSLMPVLKSEAEGLVDPERTWVVTGRERHVGGARPGGLPYPQRAIRTQEHLYIVNFEPDRWPMGDPKQLESNPPTTQVLRQKTVVTFADVDASPTKAYIIEHRDEPENRKYFDYAFAKRPREELYILKQDPDQVRNMADNPEYASVKAELEKRLMEELRATEDPRVVMDDVPFEKPPYTDVTR